MLCIIIVLGFGLSPVVNGQVTATAYQNNCNYTEVDLTWRCDSQFFYFNSSLQQLVAVNYSDFARTGYEVVHLSMDNFHGTIPNNTFATFANRTYTYTQGVDSNGIATDKAPEPTLTFNCDFTYQGFILWHETSFVGLEFVRHLIFNQCRMSQYPDGGLAPFNNLFTLSVYGGVINNIHQYVDGLKGMNVIKDSNAPGSGTVYIGAQILPDQYPGLIGIWLAPLENATKITLIDQTFQRLGERTLEPLNRLQYLELIGHSLFTLPDEFFEYGPALGTINMLQLDWFCSCGVPWWESRLNTLGINWKADQVCSYPNAQRGKTLPRFSDEVGCIPPPGFDTSRIPKILMACGAILVAIVSGLVWIPIFPLYEKVMVKSIVQEWADVPDDAEPVDPPIVDEMKIEIRTSEKGERDKAAMERRVKAQLKAAQGVRTAIEQQRSQ